MNIRTISFDYLDVQINVAVADPELNPLYRAASITYVQPISFAIALGRVDEQRATDALARCYAEGVIVGSPTPGLDAYGVKEWYSWLKAHPAEFDQLRGLCEVTANFDPNAEVPSELSTADSTNEEGSG